LLEGVARREPLVVVVEDIHWAEPTLLDLLEHLATRADDVPLFLVCLARPELLDDRPAWLESAGDRGSLVRLDALAPGAAEELLERLAPVAGDGADGRGLLLERAEGNPFFLQQMVAMRSELGDPTELPPTIQAVLTARIDSLPRAERAVIERASIEGRTFHRGALAELLPEDERDGLDVTLATLVRRGLVAPHRPDFRGERGYSFEHILIRDATYSLIPKQVRAELHERHAHWLEAHGDETGEHLELAGYHLEQAFRWHVELEPAAAGSYRPLAAAGGRHLGAAGRAALARDDTPAAIAILERATALLPADDGELGALLPELGIALTEAGRLADAERLLSDAVGAAAVRGDARAEAHALAARLFVRLQADTETGAQEVRECFEQLLINFERSLDDLGLSRLWRLRALIHWIEACSTKAEAAWENAAEHARLAGDERGWAESLSWLASSAYVGPTPAEVGVGRCEDIHAQLAGHRRSQALVLEHLAALLAMQGEFDEARGLLTEGRGLMAELGTTLHTAVSHDEAFVALASGDPVEAESLLRAGYDRLSGMGEKALLATTAAMLAQVVYERGRREEAWQLTVAAEEAAATDDVSVQIGWRAVRARLLARRGEPEAARRLSEAAVALARGTDWLTDHGDALVAHADVLQAIDDDEEAERACEEAVALYTRKGNSVGVERARALLGYSPAI
jgi:tetratricopeptide (TPR) repeat protein